MSPGLKAPLYGVTRSILLRPISTARFLRFKLSEDEPWHLSKEDLAEWPTARAMAERLFVYHRRGQSPLERGNAVPLDYPHALITEWSHDWGRESMLKLVEALGDDAPLSLRVNRKFPKQEVKDDLQNEGWMPDARMSRLSPQGLTSASYASVLGSEWFKKGAFEIQDEGSQVMAWFALWPELFKGLLRKTPHGGVPKEAIPLPTRSPPWTVIDACAGAGGKTLALADGLNGFGRVYAYDVSPKKLDALKKRARRAGFSNVQTAAVEEGAEEKVVKKFEETADVVLVDAPCSGLGVLRRNPHIKWQLDPASLDRFPDLQLGLLNTYLPLVKPKGRLVYGVCTFRREETLAVTDRFLAGGAFTLEASGFLGPAQSDGFYMASFVRK